MRDAGRGSRVLVRALAGAAAVLLALGLAQQPIATGAHVTHPYRGITYIDRSETSPRAIHIHAVQVDLTAPGVRFTLSPPAGEREVVRQTTLEFLEQEHAQVAINAHFFLPFPSSDPTAWIIGIGASNGRVYSAFETPEQRYAIVANSPGLNIDRENHAAIVHRDPSKQDGLHVREAVTLWTTVSGSAQIVTRGRASVPTYRDAAHPAALLEPRPRAYSNATSWYDVTTARSAIGLSRDGHRLMLFTVDARGRSQGMRVGEVAAMLIEDYGVWDAINLDGGGSTSLAMADPTTGAASLVNSSSDNPLGRSVGSSLAVFAAGR